MTSEKKDPALAGAESHTQSQQEHSTVDATLQAFDTATGLLMRHSGKEAHYESWT